MRHRMDRAAGSSIEITKCANGWIVTMPRVYPSVGPDLRGEMADGMAEGLRAAMPMVRDLMKEMHKDPLLAQIEEDNRQEEEEPEEDAPVIGCEDYIHVFPNFSQVLVFLEEQFPEGA